MKTFSFIFFKICLLLLACSQATPDVTNGLDEFFNEADASGNFEADIDVNLIGQLKTQSLGSLVDSADLAIWEFKGRTPKQKAFQGLMSFEDKQGEEQLQLVDSFQRNDQYRFKGSKAMFRDRDVAVGYSFGKNSPDFDPPPLHLVMAIASNDSFGERSNDSLEFQMVEDLCLTFNYQADYLDVWERSVLRLKGIPLGGSDNETLANGLASTETAQLKDYGSHTGTAEGCFTGELVSGSIGQVFKGQTDSLSVYIDDIIIGVKANVLLELFSHSDEQRN